MMLSTFFRGLRTHAAMQTEIIALRHQIVVFQDLKEAAESPKKWKWHPGSMLEASLCFLLHFCSIKKWCKGRFWKLSSIVWNLRWTPTFGQKNWSAKVDSLPVLLVLVSSFCFFRCKDPLSWADAQHTRLQLVKRSRAMLESTPSRNSQLETHPTMSRGVGLGVGASIVRIDFLCLL